MRQALGIRELPQCDATPTGWLGRLRIRLFGSSGRKRAIELQHCSPHLLRDIGLLDDRRASHLLCDDGFYRR